MISGLRSEKKKGQERHNVNTSFIHKNNKGTSSVNRGDLLGISANFARVSGSRLATMAFALVGVASSIKQTTPSRM